MLRSGISLCRSRGRSQSVLHRIRVLRFGDFRSLAFLAVFLAMIGASAGTTAIPGVAATGGGIGHAALGTRESPGRWRYAA